MTIFEAVKILREHIKKNTPQNLTRFTQNYAVCPKTGEILKTNSIIPDAYNLHAVYRDGSVEIRSNE